jgi:hypothetical protein
MPMSSGRESHRGGARPLQKWTEGIDEEHRLRNVYRQSCRELRSLSLVHSLDNPHHENKNRTWRIANQLTQVSVAARYSSTLTPARTAR